MKKQIITVTHEELNEEIQKLSSLQLDTLIRNMNFFQNGFQLFRSNQTEKKLFKELEKDIKRVVKEEITDQEQDPVVFIFKRIVNFLISYSRKNSYPFIKDIILEVSKTPNDREMSNDEISSMGNTLFNIFNEKYSEILKIKENKAYLYGYDEYQVI